MKPEVRSLLRSLSDQPVKWPAAALWTLFAEFCAQSLASCQRKPFSLWEMCKDVMGRLPGSQSVVCTVKSEETRVCARVFLTKTLRWAECLLHGQLWSWHAGTALSFLLAVRPSTFFPPAPQLSTKVLSYLFICWVWFVQERSVRPARWEYVFVLQ